MKELLSPPWTSASLFFFDESERGWSHLWEEFKIWRCVSLLTRRSVIVTSFPWKSTRSQHTVGYAQKKKKKNPREKQCYQSTVKWQLQAPEIHQGHVCRSKSNQNTVWAKTVDGGKEDSGTQSCIAPWLQNLTGVGQGRKATSTAGNARARCPFWAPLLVQTVMGRVFP